MAAITSITRTGLAENSLALAGMAQVLQRLAEDCAIDCALWLQMEGAEGLQGWAIGSYWGIPHPSPAAMQPMVLATLPNWWQAWQPEGVSHLTTGDLLVPVWLDDRPWSPSTAVPHLALHLRKRIPEAAYPPLSDRAIALATAGTTWSQAEQQTMQYYAQIMSLTLALLGERAQVAQLQQQSALLARIAHLLNSNLEPQTILQQVLAELGQFCQGDRLFLVDLRIPATPALTAIWNDLEGAPVFDPAPFSETLWPELLELFLQDGASYLLMQADAPEPDAAAALCGALKASSILLVPVFVQSEFFGLIGLVLLQPAPTYPLEAIQVIHQVADQAAIALAQMRVNPHSRLMGAVSGQADPWQDSVTGLANRDALDQEIIHLSNTTLWATQPNFSILLGDLDYFKLINDTYGFHIGDEVLKVVAGRLLSQLRQGTPLYRYEGEEFVIILPDTTLHQAADVAERLRAAVQHPPIKTESGSVEVTLSFGVACRDLPQDSNAEAVLDRAEAAMKEAKRQGRNRVKVL